MAKLIDRTGQRYGRLVVLGREGSDRFGRATWACACDCGQQTVVQGGDLVSGHTKSCGCRKIAAAKARKGVPVMDAPGYHGAHSRVRRALGKASEYTCVECGAPAEDWAYDHEDPNELVAAERGRMLPYSADICHYLPMCRPCHTRFDKATSTTAPGGLPGNHHQQ